ncbi:PPK2 family polyphosphate kinase [Streptomyces lomondensis]|uniref:Polyphosphate--nucleotide phosphotransferase n=1 Tax=Streptomyces lomondensis TaxID=68229 RepID=A0ABQ2X9U9_9ACTN|nr:PPK2 family polyphosphate kinase [Streptomyces lomondensis]MCF0077168.1 polyphosphate kinase 2 family protein [Streptomyces lomondensis]GGX06187.1 polyphosphate--nucleotide phosphotransferase [Streptomyces lomondensis]
MARKDSTSLRKRLRLPGGEPVDLSAHDAATTPGGPGGKAAGKAATARIGGQLAGLQERLWAASTAGDRRRVLLVLQGMDTSGKGGTVKHVIGLLNPSGCRITAFKAPTAEERAHPFLWRVEKALPLPGELGIFDRSHYEDVLIARVRGLAPAAEIDSRYELINRFEKSLADDGVTLVKCFLHLSYEEQRRRLLRRLDRPEKRWKFAPSDIDDRALWPAYQEAYETALERCGTSYAPWYLVPADHKWYRNWAVSTLLLEHLRELDPRYPEPDYDVAECRKRLLEQS